MQAAVAVELVKMQVEHQCEQVEQQVRVMLEMVAGRMNVSPRQNPAC